MALDHNDLNLLQLKNLLDQEGVFAIEDGLYIADVKFSERNLPLFRYPTKFNGYLGVFCVSGNLKLMKDLLEFNVRRNTFTIFTPGNILKMENNEPGITCHVIAIALSTEYMTKLKFDISRLFSSPFSPAAYPSIEIGRAPGIRSSGASAPSGRSS